MKINDSDWCDVANGVAGDAGVEIFSTSALRQALTLVSVKTCSQFDAQRNTGTSIIIYCELAFIKVQN